MHLDFNNKRILITGGTGSWGNELTKQLLEKYNPKQIIIYSRGELAQVMMSRKFSDYKNIKYAIGDVRDLTRLMECMKNVDYVFHLAALKHVPVCEDYPEESVKTNVTGTENVVKAAKLNNVSVVIDVSTDKACNPINVYGSCKSLGEKLMIQANDEHSTTKFVCIRAGNVMGTNGSIIPFFKDLLKNTDKKLPITDIGMTRYFMTLEQAIGLVFKATEQCFGGEIFVTKMPACNILDIAQVLADYYKKELDYEVIGIRPGEKLHEELVSEYESINTVESDNFRIILPMTHSLEKQYDKYPKMVEHKYTSNDELMNKIEIKQMLQDGGFLSN
ncbi:polysaccharide biosynthesis protein [Candidatus Gracilibacteria bacterium]|nr:polysaccharide biosynthesis protein [Candidatus Gracilibacteria bacterium]